MSRQNDECRERQYASESEADLVNTPTAARAASLLLEETRLADDSAVLNDVAQQWRAGLPHYLEQALELRRELHANPRIGGDEDDTANVIAERLADLLTFTTVAGTGRIGRLGGKNGPAVGIRAELDGLPVREKTEATFASTNGSMHACGHDVHLAALVLLLNAAADLDLPVPIAAVLQPREECYPSGARDMVEAKALESHRIAHMIGVHVHPQVPVGTVATGAGYINAAADEIDITVSGRGGHGAYPHHAADPVAAISHIAIGIPEVVRRTVTPMSPAVVSIGTLSAGEGAANVLPHQAQILATMRTTTAEDREALFAAVRTLAEGTANAYGLNVDVTLVSGEPVLYNDDTLAGRVETWVEELGGQVAEPMRSLGADDFSYFCDIVPSVMSFVGVETQGVEGVPALHDATFLPAERAVLDVAEAMLAGYLAAAEQILRGTYESKFV